MVASSIPSRRG